MPESKNFSILLRVAEHPQSKDDERRRHAFPCNDRKPYANGCGRNLRKKPRHSYGRYRKSRPHASRRRSAITASNLKNNATGRIYGNTIHVQASHIQNEKNTDLKGAVIASEADAGKNRLSTRKFSFSDLKNEASMPSNTIVTDIKDTMTGK